MRPLPGARALCMCAPQAGTRTRCSARPSPSCVEITWPSYPRRRCACPTPPPSPRPSRRRESSRPPALPLTRALPYPYPYTPHLNQALREIFRFRDAALPQRPLADPLDYELLRSFLRSGETIAHSFFGPLSFNSLGQNTGREATTLQVYAGRAHAVLPDTSADRNYSLSYPAPAAVGCAGGGTAVYSASTCALCAPSQCDSALSTSELLLLLLLALVCVALALAAVGKVRQIKGRQRLLLVRGTGRPPPLKRPPWCNYHLFLSHTWANGQDQCQKIKNQLRISVPTARVFLDVDDLEETSPSSNPSPSPDTNPNPDPKLSLTPNPNP